MESEELKKLQNDIIKFRDERDWGQFHNPKDLAISISLEAAELLECFQWKNSRECNDYIQTRRESVAEEMADVFNYLLIMAHDLDIDLLKVTRDKLTTNNQKYPSEKARGNHQKYTEL